MRSSVSTPGYTSSPVRPVLHRCPHCHNVGTFGKSESQQRSPWPRMYATVNTDQSTFADTPNILGNQRGSFPGASTIHLCAYRSGAGRHGLSVMSWLARRRPSVASIRVHPAGMAEPSCATECFPQLHTGGSRPRSWPTGWWPPRWSCCQSTLPELGSADGPDRSTVFPNHPS